MLSDALFSILVCGYYLDVVLLHFEYPVLYVISYNSYNNSRAGYHCHEPSSIFFHWSKSF